MYIIKVERSLPAQFMWDVMVTAVESGYSGIGHWAHLIDLNRDEDLNILNFTAVDTEAYQEAAMTLSQDAFMAEAERWYVDADRVSEAIQKILNGDVPISHYIKEYIRNGVLDDDSGDLDAIAADCIVQVAAFGEVVFG